MGEKKAIADVRLLRCPQAFVEAKLAIVTRNRTKPLLLLLSDLGTRQDVPRWLDKNNINFEILVDSPTEMHIQITASA